MIESTRARLSSQFLPDVNRHLSESAELKNLILKVSKEANNRIDAIHQKTLSIIAPAGIGKTVFFLSVIAPILTSKDNGYMVIFAVPYSKQSKQLFEDLQDEGKTYYDNVRGKVLIANKDNKNDWNNDENTNLIIGCTYDVLAQVFAKAKEFAAKHNLKVCVIADESHLIPDSVDFRFDAVHGVLKAMQKSDFVVTTTATSSIALDWLMGAEIVYINRTTQAKINLNTIVLPEKKGVTMSMQIDALCWFILDLLKRGVKVLFYIDDFTILITIKEVLILNGVEDDDISIYTGEKTKRERAEYNSLFSESKFEDNVKVVLCTRVLVQAVNINNQDFEIGCFITKKTNFKIRNIYQLCSRLRHNIANSIPINCTVFIPNSVMKGLNGKQKQFGIIERAAFELSKAKTEIKESAALLQYMHGKESNPTGVAAAISAVFNSALFRPKSPFCVRGLRGFSAAKVAHEAEKKAIEYQTFEGAIREFKTYAGANNCTVSEPIELKIKPASQITLVGIKNIEERKELVKGLVLSDLIADSSNCEAFAAEIVQDWKLARGLDGGNYTDPEGYEKAYGMKLERLYINELSTVAKEKSLTGEWGCVIEGMKIKRKNASEVLSLFYTAYEFTTFVSKEKSLEYSEKELYTKLLTQNAQNRFNFNLLDRLLNNGTSLFLGEYELQLKELSEEIENIKDKIKTDKKNKGRHEKKLKTKEIALKNKKSKARKESVIKKISELKEITYTDLFERLSKDSIKKVSNISDKNLKLFLKYLTNCKQGKKSLFVPNTLKIDFSNFMEFYGVEDVDLFYKNSRLKRINKAVQSAIDLFSSEQKCEAYEIAKDLNVRFDLGLDVEGLYCSATNSTANEVEALTPPESSVIAVLGSEKKEVAEVIRPDRYDTNGVNLTALEDETFS